MLLQPCAHQQKLALSSSFCYSRSLPWKSPQLVLPQSINYQKLPITCSMSQVYSYGAVDYERRPMINWNSIYRRISMMENPELGSGSVLNQCVKEGKKLTKWELCRVVKELRKFRRYKQALEVYDWMSNRGDRYTLSASDAAIQLDLVAKVHGVSNAENFFKRIPDNLKDRRIYGAMLNTYVRAKMREQSESLIAKMRDKGYTSQALPFNVMMTLYMNLKEFEKVESMISEMRGKNILLDLYSYNIWLSSRGSRGSVEGMEDVFEQMKLDKNVNPNWTTFSTIATMYIKMGLLEKAVESLRRVESRITGRDRIPYHYLLSLYGNVGIKEEVYRVWNIYKSIFPTIPNLGYHAVISSLVRMGDIEGAERIYDEWLPVKTSYDPRILNLIMGWYVKEGNVDKAESLLDHMIEAGGKPNSNTWEILADGYIGEKRTSEALSCLKEAFAADGSKSWKPKPIIIASFFKLCKEEDDIASKEVFEGLLKESGFLADKAYISLLDLSISDNEISTEKDNTDENDNEDNVESDMLVNQLQETM